MSKNLIITDKMVLGTAQFGMDYGIANVSGKPTKKEVYEILELAWDMGVRRYDTAPSYGSEELLGEFVHTNGIDKEISIMTKISNITELENVRTSVEQSLKNLGCLIDVLFFHKFDNSEYLSKNPSYFKKIMKTFPVSKFGVSVYNPENIKAISECDLDLVFQFPYNVLDRRFEITDMPLNRRFARSIFLQGILVAGNHLRFNAPTQLIKIKKRYHQVLNDFDLDPLSVAISFVAFNENIDYFLVGVDSKKQLQEIFLAEKYFCIDQAADKLFKNISDEYWIDPRNWFVDKQKLD